MIVSAQSPGTFCLKTNIRFGEGVAGELPEHLSQMGVRRPLLIVDSGVARAPTWGRLAGTLERCRLADVVECGIFEPTYDDLDALRPKVAGSEPDCIIAIGGGSIIDIGKAMSVLITNDRSLPRQGAREARMAAVE